MDLAANEKAVHADFFNGEGAAGRQLQSELFRRPRSGHTREVRVLGRESPGPVPCAEHCASVQLGRVAVGSGRQPCHSGGKNSTKLLPASHSRRGACAADTVLGLDPAASLLPLSRGGRSLALRCLPGGAAALRPLGPGPAVLPPAEPGVRACAPRVTCAHHAGAVFLGRPVSRDLVSAGDAHSSRASERQ